MTSVDVANHWSTYQPRPRNHNTTQQSPECFCLLVSNSTVFIVSPHPYFNIFAHFFTRKELVHKCWFSKLHPLVSPKCMHIVPFKNILDHVFFSPGLHKKIMRNRHQEKVWQNTQTRKLLSCACVDLLWSPCPHWPCCRSSCCPVFTRPKPSLHWAETGRPLLYNSAQHQLAVLPPSTSPQHRHLQLTRETVLIYIQPSLNCFIHFYYSEKLYFHRNLKIIIIVASKVRPKRTLTLQQI